MKTIVDSSKSALLFVVLTVLMWTPRASAQIDPDERKDLYIGVSAPLTKSLGNLDKGHGDPSEAGYFHFNKLHWPTDNMQFRLIFAGVYADTMFTWPTAFD